MGNMSKEGVGSELAEAGMAQGLFLLLAGFTFSLQSFFSLVCPGLRPETLRPIIVQSIEDTTSSSDRTTVSIGQSTPSSN